MATLRSPSSRRGVDRKIPCLGYTSRPGFVALLAEGAWIKFRIPFAMVVASRVALAEGVDKIRNQRGGSEGATFYKVALLAEGVDRNGNPPCQLALWCLVALLAEGVDKNTFYRVCSDPRLCRPPRGGRG